MDKLKTIDEAIDLIKDGDTVAVSGFMMATAAREILVALGKRYKTTSTPKGLTLYQGAGNGNNNDQGVCEMSYPGLIKRKSSDITSKSIVTTRIGRPICGAAKPWLMKSVLR